jgi:hypothetical protein
MKKLFLLILIVIIGGYYFLNNSLEIQSGLPDLTRNAIVKPIIVTPKSPRQIKNVKTVINKNLKKTMFKIPTNEKESLNAYSTIMRDFSNTKKSKEELIIILNKLKLQVIQKYDSNEDTGSMSIIRTQKTLPGTRYFHAQYFGDDQGQTLQHLSFELKPGPNAMEAAKSALIKKFSLSQKPTMDKKGFTSWHQSSGYTLSIKQLTSEDLKDDLFNAYVASDIGTIRVSMELEIHGQYEGHQEKHQ